LKKYGEPSDKVSRDDGYEFWNYYDTSENVEFGFMEILFQKSGRTICAVRFFQQGKSKKNESGDIVATRVQSPVLGTEKCVKALREEIEKLEKKVREK